MLSILVVDWCFYTNTPYYVTLFNLLFLCWSFRSEADWQFIALCAALIPYRYVVRTAQSKTTQCLTSLCVIGTIIFYRLWLDDRRSAVDTLLLHCSSHLHFTNYRHLTCTRPYNLTRHLAVWRCRMDGELFGYIQGRWVQAYPITKIGCLNRETEKTSQRGVRETLWKEGIFVTITPNRFPGQYTGAQPTNKTVPVRGATCSVSKKEWQHIRTTVHGSSNTVQYSIVLVKQLIEAFCTNQGQITYIVVQDLGTWESIWARTFQMKFSELLYLEHFASYRLPCCNGYSDHINFWSVAFTWTSTILLCQALFMIDTFTMVPAQRS